MFALWTRLLTLTGVTSSSVTAFHDSSTRSRLLVVYVAGKDPTSVKRQVFVEEMWRGLEVRMPCVSLAHPIERLVSAHK